MCPPAIATEGLRKEFDDAVAVRDPRSLDPAGRNLRLSRAQRRGKDDDAADAHDTDDADVGKARTPANPS